MLDVALFDETTDLIHVYTRAEAIADGMLVDVTAPARALGIVLPMAITAAAWGALVERPDADPAWALRSLLVVCVAQLRAARAAGAGGDRLEFRVQCSAEPVAVWLAVGPGDHEEPVLTLLLRGED